MERVPAGLPVYLRTSCACGRHLGLEMNVRTHIQISPSPLRVACPPSLSVMSVLHALAFSSRGEKNFKICSELLLKFLEQQLTIRNDLIVNSVNDSLSSGLLASVNLFSIRRILNQA